MLEEELERDWDNEKIQIKKIITVENNYFEALNLINILLPEVLIDTRKDIIYYFLFNKALCLYKLNREDESIPILKKVAEYAESKHEYMKIDWTYGLCYAKTNVELAIYHYDLAINYAKNRNTPDKISEGQIKCTKAMLLNDVKLMEEAVKVIESIKPSNEVLDIAYNSLSTIYIKNSFITLAYETIKKIHNKDTKELLRNKILSC
jgi:tetratricopeptide (TPR) repeat protein